MGHEKTWYPRGFQPPVSIQFAQLNGSPCPFIFHQMEYSMRTEFSLLYKFTWHWALRISLFIVRNTLVDSGVKFCGILNKYGVREALMIQHRGDYWWMVLHNVWSSRRTHNRESKIQLSEMYPFSGVVISQLDGYRISTLQIYTGSIKKCIGIIPLVSINQ